jgi:hypothetical protein
MEFDTERLRDSEARDWIRRFKQKVRELGRGEAISWWNQTITDIERKRGTLMAIDLNNRMRKIQDESKKS